MIRWEKSADPVCEVLGSRFEAFEPLFAKYLQLMQLGKAAQI
jgi:hypothetical protein